MDTGGVVATGVDVPRTWGVVEELDTLSAVVEAVGSGVDEAETVAVGVADGEETTGRAAVAETEAAGRIKGRGAVVPSETKSFSSGDAKECQSKIASDVTGFGVWMVNPPESFLVMKEGTTWPSAVIVTIG